MALNQKEVDELKSKLIKLKAENALLQQQIQDNEALSIQRHK